MCLQIAAGVIAGIGGLMGNLQAKAAANANAKAQDAAAQQEQQAGAYASARKTEQVQRALGEERANISSNGLGLTGTSAAIVNESAVEGQLDVDAIRWNATTRANNLRYQAAVSRMNAKAEGFAAPISFLTPVIGSVAKYAESAGTFA
jgi:hypothetical protein